VLDMRSNPGGLLDPGLGALQTCSLVPRQPNRPALKGRGRIESSVTAIRRAEMAPACALVLLVDVRSASSTEIVGPAPCQDTRSSADHRESPRYGKGRRAERDRTWKRRWRMKITTARWYTTPCRAAPRSAGALSARTASRIRRSPKKLPDPRWPEVRFSAGGGISPDVCCRPSPLCAASRPDPSVRPLAEKSGLFPRRNYRLTRLAPDGAR
jgi:hypothetical protein